MAYQVFISYRRKDQRTLVEWLHRDLSAEIPADEIFLDTSEIEPGDVFPDRIEDALRSAVIFVIVIGKDWEGRDPMNPTGLRRLDNPKDYVRKEAAQALAYKRLDRRKLVLPVLCDGLHMPAVDALPEELHDLHTLHKIDVVPNRQAAGVDQIIEKVVKYIDHLGGMPEEEKWILHEIRILLESLGRDQVRRIGHLFAGRYPDFGAVPDSARSLATALYRTGPPALEFLLRFRRGGEDFRRLLHLLATYWINAREVAALRRAMVPARIGKRFAIDCRRPDFTPAGSLLKASREYTGWPDVAVKASDPPAEIVQQIHDKLAQMFYRQIASPTSPGSPPVASTPEKQREKICEVLHRRIEVEGRALPVVLHLGHLTALDGTLIDAVHKAFPPLHILIATADLSELTHVSSVSQIVRPSDRRDSEEKAYDEFAQAADDLDRRERTLA